MVSSRPIHSRSPRPGIPGRDNLRSSRSSLQPMQAPRTRQSLRSSRAMPSKQSKPSKPASSRPIPFAARTSRTTLQAMPNRSPLPPWLKLLKKVEKLSLTITFGLVCSAVATYGWAVHSQQQWGDNFSHLKNLRRDERQLLKSSELMKNDIARHNDPKQYGLVPRNAENIVVIPPAPLRPALPTRNTGLDPKAKPITPIGY